MASEATMLENAPVTPAHQFAWRAFRGFVYGSPESPGKPTLQFEQENKMSSKRQSPAKRISMAPTAPLLSPQKRKRDTAPQLSPTKSILRTPGAPTPRAKSLRDVNVTFKSISPEMRTGPIPMPVPQLSSTAPPAIEHLEKQVDELWQELEQSLVENRSPQQAPVPAPRVPQQKVKAEPAKKVASKKDAPGLEKRLAALSVDVDHEEYARRTEKEVKRLLRQHKKLRDYAQRADEQNMRLYAMVGQLQKENARLKERLEKVDAINAQPKAPGKEETSQGSGLNEQVQKPSAPTGPAPPQPAADTKTRDHEAEERSTSRTDAFKRSLRGDGAGFSIHADALSTHQQPERPPPVTQPRPSPKKRSSTSELRPSLTTAGRKQQNSDSQIPTQRSSQSLRGLKSSHPLAVPSPAPRHPTIAHAPRNKVPTTNASPFSLTALAAELEPTPAATRPVSAPSQLAALPPATAVPITTTTPGAAMSSRAASNVAPLNMAPDRVAAARLRLARRSEERKASGSGTGIGAGVGIGMNQTTWLIEREMAKGVVGVGDGDEESAVDWARI